MPWTYNDFRDYLLNLEHHHPDFKIIRREEINNVDNTDYEQNHVPHISDFRERAAIFDHTVRGALSPPHTSRAPGFATKDQASARDSNAAQGNTQDMEAT